MFRFKQFDVDQTACAMKINTDGVLLGALADTDHPKTILDIGTGTGVIALMLAQRFPDAQIDAVEIDEQAAETAARNFANSPFAERMNVYPFGFEDFFSKYADKRYDLIVSNPPFYINSLKSPNKDRQVAKYADERFFERLVNILTDHLSVKGLCYLILPLDTAELVRKIILKTRLGINTIVSVCSYPDSEAHREILVISIDKVETETSRFVIYDSLKKYSAQYSYALKNFFTIF
jgi:tRNA1Val (adenine37-N6)-methyltransferase